jgi:type IV fimbrial biogenesis protein FimT
MFMPGKNGFTLLEMLLILSLMAILAGLPLGGYTRLAEVLRLQMATQRLVSSLQFARTEAILRNTRVTLCRSADGLHCAQAGGWEQGWIVFVDSSHDGQMLPESRLAVVAAQPPGVTIVGNSPLQAYVSYNALGSPRRWNDALQMGRFTLCAGRRGRQIIFNRTGRIRVESESCA